MKPAKPDVVGANLADSIQLLAGIEDKYRWIYAAAHTPPRRGETNGGSRGGGHSDPTAGAALDAWNEDLRQAMAEACRGIAVVHRTALKAYRMLAKAEGREPEHGYSPIEPTYTTKDELADADAAQARRAERGGRT